MGLKDSQFQNDLTLSVNQKEWTDCASKMSKAIQDYVTSGEVSTTIPGTHFLPPGGSEPITIHGKKGQVISITSSGLTEKLIEAFQEDTFEAAAKTIAEVVDIYVKSCTIFVNQYEESIYIGTGVGPPSSTGLVPIVPVGYSALEAAIIGSFAVPNAPWSIFVSLFSTGVKIYLTTCIVNTYDVGASPLAGWFGFGIGSIS